MALRLNGSQSQLYGFPGLAALGEPPMSGDLIIMKIIITQINKGTTSMKVSQRLNILTGSSSLY